MNTPHDGRQDRYSSDRRGGLAGTEELAEAGDGSEEARPEQPEGSYRPDEPESGRPEDTSDYSTLSWSADPGQEYGAPEPHGDPFSWPADPGQEYGAPEPQGDPESDSGSPERHPGVGPEPPYHSPSPGAWYEPRPAPPGPAPLPADQMPGFGQAYPGADPPSAPDRDWGTPAGEFGGADPGRSEFGSTGDEYGGSQFGGGEYGGGEYGGGYGGGFESGESTGHFGSLYRDDTHVAGQSAEGAAEAGYGQETEGFDSPVSGFGASEYQDRMAAGLPPAPPDVPVGLQFAPPHIEADPSALEGLRDRRDQPAGTEDTFAGPATAAGSRTGPGRFSDRTARMPRPRVRATGREGSHGRQANVMVGRVEPVSVMKFSFVVSVVAFIVLFVAVAVLYGVLAGLGVWDSLQHTIESLTSGQGASGVNAAQWFSASRILGYTALFGAVNIILITALSTVGAVLYNAAARLIGGVEVTLNETE